MARKVLVVCLLVSLLIAAFGYQYVVRAEEKPKYLVLVAREDVKDLYRQYIAERIEEYDIRIISLEREQVLNKPERIKKWLISKKAIWDFQILVLDEFVSYGSITIDRGEGLIVKIMTDAYYYNLDDDQNYHPEIAVSRITRSFLKVAKWQIFPTFNAGIALPFWSFPHSTYCPSCIVEARDLTPYGEDRKKEAMGYGDVVRLYDTRSSIQPKFQPDYSLTAENYQTVLAQSALWLYSPPGEPHNAYKDWEGTIYNTPVVAIWDDLDKNGKVEDKYNTEITIEQLCDSKIRPDNKKRIGIMPMSDSKDFLLTVNYFYNSVVEINPGNTSSNLLSSAVIWKLLLEGYSVGEAVSLCMETALPQNTDLVLDNIQMIFLSMTAFGPPETKITDIAENSKIVLDPLSIQDSGKIDFGFNSKADFFIKNIGNGVLKWKVTKKSDWFSISLDQGEVQTGGQTEVQILIVPNIPGVTINSLPKKRQGSIIIETNDPDRRNIKLIVTAEGIFNGW